MGDFLLRGEEEEDEVLWEESARDIPVDPESQKNEPIIASESEALQWELTAWKELWKREKVHKDAKRKSYASQAKLAALRRAVTGLVEVLRQRPDCRRVLSESEWCDLAKAAKETPAQSPISVTRSSPYKTPKKDARRPIVNPGGIENPRHSSFSSPGDCSTRASMRRPIDTTRVRSPPSPERVEMLEMEVTELKKALLSLSRVLIVEWSNGSRG